MSEVSLRDYLDKAIEGLRIEIGAVEKRTDSKLQLNSVAAEKALIALNERLETMNQFRQQINSERGLYITRDMLDLIIKPLQTRLEQDTGIRYQVHEQEGRTNDSTARWLGIAGIAIAAFEVLIILLRP